MTPPKYYIQRVDIEAFPVIGQVQEGRLSVNLEFLDPNLNDRNHIFTCDCKLEMDLYPPKSEERPDYDKKYADIFTRMTIYKEGDPDRLVENYEQWEDGEYGDMDETFRYNLESDLLLKVISPIADLFEDSHRGISPKISFTIEDGSDD